MAAARPAAYRLPPATGLKLPEAGPIMSGRTVLILLADSSCALLQVGLAGAQPA